MDCKKCEILEETVDALQDALDIQTTRNKVLREANRQFTLKLSDLMSEKKEKEC